MKWLVYQWQLLLLSVSFFSRIPVPRDLPYSSERMNRSGRYFPTVGFIIGVLCAAIYLLMASILPSHIAVLGMMAFSLLLTGAFHEDGLTDMADGIGGGMTIERRLAIMKDSRIGTYGAATLIVALLMKFQLLSYLASELSSTYFALLMVAVHVASRSVAASIIYSAPYVSDTDTSKSKPLANSQTLAELGFILTCGFVVLLPFTFVASSTIILILAVFRQLFMTWLNRRIGGFTGDCLGAAQQISELLMYAVLVSFVHHQWVIV
ncbi:adenosylcobinamide-GDP ribazoletransferase [Vibrio maerlii]|uniref:adenosylcobinamide-GDP ribazoletransferase n=1 Tax=Vibrio maerlii TaxID=2231648 RepID=UPI000E3DB93E|nr:adenosylcobinamide-GDP ribazoletransferase [Vibrio maerlii]